MNKKIILVDMDDVLADFEGQFLETWKKKFPRHPYVPIEKRETFRIEDNYPGEFEKDIRNIYTAPGFFENLSLIPGAKEAIAKMQSLGHDVFICTSPISAYENCVLEKYHWVAKNLGYEWTKRMIVTKDKTLIYGDILIDDKPEHKGLRTPLWKYVLFDAPYNKKVKANLRITWKNWEKILEI